jgi:hypothetical protein
MIKTNWCHTMTNSFDPRQSTRHVSCDYSTDLRLRLQPRRAVRRATTDRLRVGLFDRCRHRPDRCGLRPCGAVRPRRLAADRIRQPHRPAYRSGLRRCAPKSAIGCRRSSACMRCRSAISRCRVASNGGGLHRVRCTRMRRSMGWWRRGRRLYFPQGVQWRRSARARSLPQAGLRKPQAIVIASKAKHQRSRVPAVTIVITLL